MAKSVAIIGAGMGGLALAVRLAHRGYDVQVFEKNNFLGGRNHPIEVGASQFDSGPTLLMMLDPLQKLFRDIGEDLEQKLHLTLVEPGYRAWYANGSQIDAYCDRDKMKPQIESRGGPAALSAYNKLLDDVAHLYHASLDPFIRQDYVSTMEWLKLQNLAAAIMLGVFGNLWNQVSRRFSDPELQMLFSFQTMYLGLSPFKAPWVYSTLVHMEYGEGIWYAPGGIARIAELLGELARQRGCQIHLGYEATQIGERCVEFANGEVISADVIVCNADLPYAETQLLGRPRRNVEGSCGALMFYWDVGADCPALQHHNVFFSADYRGNFEAIFDRMDHANDPSFYVCVSSVTDPSRTAPGHQNVMVLVPCPRSDRPFAENVVERYRSCVIERLVRDVGFQPEAIRAELVRQPADWAQQLNLFEGSAFGLGHAMKQSAMFRPKIRDKRNRNLYYVGASTTPGNGIPMVLISAELVEARIAKDYP